MRLGFHVREVGAAPHIPSHVTRKVGGGPTAGRTRSDQPVRVFNLYERGVPCVKFQRTVRRPKA